MTPVLWRAAHPATKIPWSRLSGWITAILVNGIHPPSQGMGDPGVVWSQWERALIPKQKKGSFFDKNGQNGIKAMGYKNKRWQETKRLQFLWLWQTVDGKTESILLLYSSRYILSWAAFFAFWQELHVICMVHLHPYHRQMKFVFKLATESLNSC